MPISKVTVRQMVAAGLTCTLTALSLDVMFDGRVSALDRVLLRRPKPDPRLWRCVSVAGGRPALFAMTSSAMAAGWACRRPWWMPALSVGLGVVSRAELASRVNRARPPESWWRTRPEGPSFPSRHVTWAGLGALALAAQAPPRWRPLGYVAAGSTTAAVAASRLRLGVHWPSDAVAGATYSLAVHLLTDLAATAATTEGDATEATTGRHGRSHRPGHSSV